MSMKETEDAIKARVASKGVSRVYVAEVPPGETPALPFVILNFGYPTRAGTDRHLTNVRNDTRIGTLTVRVVSSTVDSARDLADQIDLYLTGWEPTNSGQLTPEFNVQSTNATATTQPTRYYRTMGYTYRTNLKWINEPIAW